MAMTPFLGGTEVSPGYFDNPKDVKMAGQLKLFKILI